MGPGRDRSFKERRTAVIHFFSTYIQSISSAKRSLPDSLLTGIAHALLVAFGAQERAQQFGNVRLQIEKILLGPGLAGAGGVRRRLLGAVAPDFRRRRGGGAAQHGRKEAQDGHDGPGMNDDRF